MHRRSWRRPARRSWRGVRPWCAARNISWPRRNAMTRKQLFLNFKGGTGKTSLSSNYAFRLAEMGNRVLVIDLDSQGHATKCLGYEGEDFHKTLLEVLVKRVPL